MKDSEQIIVKGILIRLYKTCEVTHLTRVVNIIPRLSVRLTNFILQQHKN